MEKVTFRLDWVASGSQTAFAVAKKKGFYGDVGLDVDVLLGKGSGSTVQQVGAGADMIGWMAQEDWEETIALLTKYGELKNARPAKEYFTNAFVPQ